MLLTSRSCTNANSEVPGSSQGTSVKLSVVSATFGSIPSLASCKSTNAGPQLVAW